MTQSSDNPGDQAIAALLDYYEDRLAFLGNALNPKCPPIIESMRAIAWDAVEHGKKERERLLSERKHEVNSHAR